MSQPNRDDYPGPRKSLEQMVYESVVLPMHPQWELLPEDEKDKFRRAFNKAAIAIVEGRIPPPEPQHVPTPSATATEVAIKGYLENRRALVEAMGEVSFVYGDNGKTKSATLSEEIARIDGIISTLTTPKTK